MPGSEPRTMSIDMLESLFQKARRDNSNRDINIEKHRLSCKERSDRILSLMKGVLETGTIVPLPYDSADGDIVSRFLQREDSDSLMRTSAERVSHL